MEVYVEIILECHTERGKGEVASVEIATYGLTAIAQARRLAAKVNEVFVEHSFEHPETDFSITTVWADDYLKAALADLESYQRGQDKPNPAEGSD